MGTTEEKLAYLEETKEKLAQGLAAQGLTPAGTFRAMAEQVAEIPSGTPLPSLTNPGTAADLLSGKQLIDGTGRVVTGSMPDIVPQRMELESGQTYTIPRGYHSGSGIITAKGGAGGSFSVPLVVTVEAGATVTATNGADTVTGVSDGTATLILPSGGTWTVTASKEGERYNTNKVKVYGSYETAITPKGVLPEGYTQLEYITNDNGGYIDLIPANEPFFEQGNRIEMQIRLKDLSKGGGVIGSTNTRRYQQTSGRWLVNRWASLIRVSGSKLAMSFYSAYKDNLTSPTTLPLETTATFDINPNEILDIVVDVGAGILQVNEEVFDLTSPSSITINNALPILLFAYIDVNSRYTNSNMEFIEMKVTKTATDELLHHYFPAINNTDGAVGIYDLVAKEFKSSAVSSSPLIAGPEI